MQCMRFIALIILIIASIYDIRSLKIPSLVVGLQLCLALICAGMRLYSDRSPDYLWTVGLSLIPLVMIVILDRLKIEAVGAGDGIAIFMMGVVLTLRVAVFAVSAAAVFAGAISALLLVSGRISPKSKLPFIPFLAAGATAGVFIWI